MYLLTHSVPLYHFSQIKNEESKAPAKATPSSTQSKTSQNGATATQKPQTTTYRAFTTTYRSSASTRSYINYNNRSDKLTELERLRLREEFYATYDVMTGVRIAATLGGFFALMVFLIVYKSRSHSTKALQVSWEIEIIFKNPGGVMKRTIRIKSRHFKCRHLIWFFRFVLSPGKNLLILK